jgi:hypothetical protein
LQQATSWGRAQKLAKQNKLFAGKKFVKRCVTDGTETVFSENIIALEKSHVNGKNSIS